MNSFTSKAIYTNSAPAPVGPYSQAVLANGWLYCSGQIPLDHSSGLLVGEGDIKAETHQVLSNLKAVLRAAGSTPSQVVRTTIYLIDLNDFEAVNAIYAEAFTEGTSPARACVQVAALPKGARIEIDCIAYLGTKEG
ncbi:RidA family protein [Prochlorococcus sp. MIT 1307]|uniref:RidA family protein n=1 Tax=Prochlorococcus sp. MIT 1307 TaxID=3096219 RepID=UPI002A74FEE5|nr:RidA family protein [Prochlorococcus sp. MIT 1307]